MRRRHDQHHDLRALPCLEGGELVLECRLLFGGQRPGQIRDPRFELRNGLEALRACKPDGSDEKREPSAADAAPLGLRARAQ